MTKLLFTLCHCVIHLKYKVFVYYHCTSEGKKVREERRKKSERKKRKKREKEIVGEC